MFLAGSESNVESGPLRSGRRFQLGKRRRIVAKRERIAV